MRQTIRLVAGIALSLTAWFARAEAYNWGLFESKESCQIYANNYCKGWCDWIEKDCKSVGEVNWSNSTTQCTGTYECAS
jgi:hypothetical protein